MTDESASQLSRRRYLQAAGVGVGSLASVGTAQAAGGDEIWHFQTGSDVYSSPTVVDGTVFVGSGDENLYAVDTATGDQQWIFETEYPVRSSPVVVDETVFVSSSDLYAVDAKTGEQQWVSSYDVTSSPTVVDGTVFVGSSDRNLYAVNATTGEKQWVFETDNGVSSSPTVVDGTVFVGCNDGNLYAVDGGSGEQQWAFEAGFEVLSSPTVAEDTVFVGSTDRSLYAVDAATGKQQWAFQTGDWVRSSPTVVNSTVFVGSENSNLYAVDTATGEQQWAFRTGDWILSSPTVVDGTVFVGSRDSNLYAVNADTGEQQWAFEAGGRVDSSPTVVDGTVFVGSDDGNLYAVDAGMPGSSEGTRVILGTLGHHDDWRYANQSIDSPPTASITVTPTAPVTNEPVTFAASESSNPDGSISSYEWSIDGTNHTGESVFHTFSDEGTYTIELTVTYEDGAADTTTQRLAVSNQPPIAEFSVSPSSPIPGEVVTFDAASSSDPDGSINSHDWIIGTPSYTGESIQHTFSDPGTYYVELTVTDDDGATDTTTEQVVVADTSEVDPDWGDWLSGANNYDGETADFRGRDEITVDVGAGDGFAFDHPAVWVDAGTTVRFDWTGAGAAHNVVGEDNDLDSGEPVESSGIEYEYTFEESGIYRYYCRPHQSQGMVGAIAVGDDIETTDPDETTPEPEDEPDSTTATLNGGSSDGSGLPMLPLAAGGGIAATGIGVAAWRLRSGDDEDGSRGAPPRGDDSSGPTPDQTTSSGQPSQPTGQSVAQQGPPSSGGQSPPTNDDDPGEAETTATDTLDGQVVPTALSYDQFEDREPIGQGGNADVYRVTVDGPDGPATIALKEPRMQGTLHTEAVDRLLGEAETWQKLDDHGHIIDVIDYDSEPLPWIAIEYMDGGDLSAVETLPLPQALEVIESIASAVDYAHRAGVAHRDLKPSNVLFTNDPEAGGIAKVGDWGLSKELLEVSQSTEGLSPQYAAPEQFDGGTEDITGPQKVDIYQTGVIAYQLVTGQPPFEGTTFEIMEQVKEGDLEPPSSVEPVISSELDEIVLTAMANDPEDRFETMTDFRRALEEVDEWP